MNIRRAIITAAGPGQTSLPLQHFVDRGGCDKTALQLIVEEAVDAGMRDICVVISPGERTNYEKAAGQHVGRLTFVEQDQPRGYGHALHCAAAFVEDEPFLHLVGDHLYISNTERGCAKQLVDVAEAEACAVSAVQATRENKLSLFGTVGGRRAPNRGDLYEITKVLEKPTPTQAEQELIVAGLRASHYLCLFGMHVLTPTVMSLLRESVEHAGPEPVQLSPALASLASRQRYLALRIKGARYNIGVKYGLLMAQLALALTGKDRDDVLTEVLEVVAATSEPAKAAAVSNG